MSKAKQLLISTGEVITPSMRDEVTLGTENVIEWVTKCLAKQKAIKKCKGGFPWKNTVEIEGKAGEKFIITVTSGR